MKKGVLILFVIFSFVNNSIAQNSGYKMTIGYTNLEAKSNFSIDRNLCTCYNISNEQSGFYLSISKGFMISKKIKFSPEIQYSTFYSDDNVNSIITLPIM